MRKQGHTHKFGHCITMTTGQSKEPVRKVTCKRPPEDGSTRCVCVYCKCVCACMCMAEGFKRISLRKKEKKKHANPVPSHFQLWQQIKYNKGINSIFNQFTALQVCPGSAWACCPSMHVYEGEGEKQRKCEFVCFVKCLYEYSQCRQATGQGTSSLGPGHGGRERMQKMKGGGGGGVYLQNDTAVTLPGLLSVPLTWTHSTQTSWLNKHPHSTVKELLSSIVRHHLKRTDLETYW